MSRRFRRLRTRLTATVHLGGEENLLVCPTRDISSHGCFLATSEPFELGAKLVIAVMDNVRGEAIEVIGTVARRVDDPAGGIGVHLEEPPEGWLTLVERLESESGPVGDQRGVRLRVLVVGDGERRRSALALYVTSGWDVRFASDLDGAREALAGVAMDAVIVEHDLTDARWPAILRAARDNQPRARRLLRCPLNGEPAPETDPHHDLVHRVVDLSAGMDALFDALTADLPGIVDRASTVEGAS